MLLEMRPHVFYRIELRGIGRQPFHGNASVGRGNELANHPRTMDGRPIPDDQQPGTFEMAVQCLEELHHLLAFDAAGMDAEEEAPQGDASDDGEAFPVEGLMQHGCLPARSPGAHTVRTGAQPRLVDEDDGALLSARFFLMAGHSTRFQCAILGSSRSMARRSGRWQLNPSERSSRLTWAGS